MVLLGGGATLFFAGGGRANVVIFVAIASFTAALLMAIETIKDRGGRFSLSTLLLIFGLLSLSLGAVGVFIHTLSFRK